MTQNIENTINVEIMSPEILGVWAQSWSKGISKSNKIPWNVPLDMKLFMNSLKIGPEGKKTAMICGRSTYECMGGNPCCKSLPYIVSTTIEKGGHEKERALKNGNVTKWTEYYSPSLVEAINEAKSNPEVGMIVIAGGARIYSEIIRDGLADTLWVTQFGRKDGPFETDNPVTPQPDDENSHYTCTGISRSIASNVDDSYVGMSVYTYQLTALIDKPKPTEWQIPSVDSILNTSIPPIDENSPPVYECLPYITERGHEEFQYLELIRNIINTGNTQIDRTTIGTTSIFGANMRFSLKDGIFPLLTTKRVFWRGVVEELLWFIKGDTNAKNLSDKGVKIWDGNSSREFLDSRGLHHREEGDLGPIYGFQWRHFGADYETMHTNYNDKGIDQLQQVIDTLKKNPSDRRMIVCAWNPSALSSMALPPCHCLFQFYASSDGKLSCLMYQRSADVGLGVPFNIASYALLTCMVAQCVGLAPHEFIHVLGNAHIYSNHIDSLKTQLYRIPRPFPVLKMNPDKQNIDDFVFEDFELLGYFPHKTIAMQMAV